MKLPPPPKVDQLSGQSRESAAPRSRARSNPLLALTRAVLLFLLTFVLYVAYLIRQTVIRGRVRRRRVVLAWTQLWARLTCRLMGWRVVGRGPPPEPGCLISPNHIGYVDILALASVTGCFFVSRADAAQWPLLGPLVRRSEQILVSRQRRRDLTGTADHIEERLKEGFSVCVFLEGTSSGGQKVLPFLPALLQPALNCGSPIVPTALRWSSRDPKIVVSEDLAYWKDHQLPRHLWRLMGLRGACAEVVFGPPLPARGERKELARAVRDGVVALQRRDSTGRSPC